MRDAKLIFRYNEDPTTAGATVDTNSTEPGAANSGYIWYSATYVGDAGTGPATITIFTSDTETGTFASAAQYLIPASRIVNGAVIISTTIPTTVKKYVRTAWSGLPTGSTITDGIDWGLTDGSAATKKYLA